MLNRCCFCASAADTPPEGSKREKAGTPEKVKDQEQGSNPAGRGEGVKEDGKEGPSVEVKEERKDVKPRKEKIDHLHGNRWKQQALRGEILS